MDDLLSNLPDDVLCHLLSFLTTKETALTSVLSKRWRNLIAFVPNLDIVDYVYLNPEKRNEKRDDSRQLFMDFVDRVLALQGTSPIKKFTLDCNCVDSVRVDAWISNVLVRNVSELDLSITLDDESDDKYHKSPRCFQNKKLVKLKIAFGTNIGWLDGSVFLPMLKTLVLHYVTLSNDKFEILLHALPVLEELVLHYITFEGSNVTVSSASLKTLTTKKSWNLVKTFSFNTPSLVYFCFTHYDVADDYSVAEMENLIEARISFLLLNYDIITPFDDWSKFANAGKLMNGIRNVQRLYLSPDTIEVLSLCSESMPMFKNLKTLTIKSDQRRGWQAMPVLLRNCPHLETLVLEGLLHHVTDKCGDACDCVVRENKGHSLTSCPIKVLMIQEFEGTTEEMHMIKHFLKYFPCLKEIKIFCPKKEIRRSMWKKLRHISKSLKCLKLSWNSTRSLAISSSWLVGTCIRSGLHNELMTTVV